MRRRVIPQYLKGIPQYLKQYLSGLTSRLLQGLLQVETVETLKWSWRKADKGFHEVWSFVIYFGLIIGLISGLIIVGLGWLNSEIALLIKETELTVVELILVLPLLGFFLGGLLGVIGGPIGGLIGGLIYGLVGGLIGGLIGGLVGGLVGGGSACFRHFTLRLVLHRQGNVPWNYARFLDYAVDRLFMQKVGGGYIFVHRMLMEHFAQMELEQKRH